MSIFSKIADVAVGTLAGFVAGGPVGALVGFGASALGQAESSKAERQAEAQQAEQDRLAFENKRLADQYVEESKLRYENNIKSINDDAQKITDLYAKAKQAGDQQASQHYIEQLTQLKQQHDNIISEIDTLEKSGTEKFLNASEEQQKAMLNDSVQNIENQDRYTKAVDEGVKSIGTSQLVNNQLLDEYSANKDKPPELDAIMSQIDDQFDTIEAEQAKRDSAKGDTTDSGVSLALKIQRAKQKGNASFQARAGYRNERTGAITNLTQNAASLASTASNLAGNRANTRYNEEERLANNKLNNTMYDIDRADEFESQKIDQLSDEQKYELGLKSTYDKGVESRTQADITNAMGHIQGTSALLSANENDYMNRYASGNNLQRNDNKSMSDMLGESANANMAASAQTQANYAQTANNLLNSDWFQNKYNKKTTTTTEPKK